MREVDTIAKGFDHFHQIVISAHAVRTGAHGKTVINAIDRFFQPLHIFDSRNDTWQAEDRARRIVRMHGQTHADFFCHWHNRPQEYRHIIAQIVLTDAVIFSETRTELIQRIALFCTRQASNDIAGQLFNFCIAHGIEVVQRLALFFGGIIRFSSRALQNVKFEGRKSNLVKTQRFGTIRQLIFEVGTRPVEDRHEVIAHRIDTTGRQITDTLLIVGNPRLILT